MPYKLPEYEGDVGTAAAAWFAEPGSETITDLEDSIDAMYVPLYYKEACTGSLAPYQVVFYDVDPLSETVICGGLTSGNADLVAAYLNSTL